jgi:hypothetical protein
MLTAPEHRPIVLMLAGGSPVWYVAAVTKSDRHHVYAVGARYGYPNRATLKRALEQLTVGGAAPPAAGGSEGLAAKPREFARCTCLALDRR